MIGKTILILSLIVLATANPADDQKQRSGRVLSLFSIVQFPNDICTSASTAQPNGLCMASSECSSKSGTASGNCASGFGVCCIFKVSTCGSTISNNVTYITNPGFPAAYTTTGTCSYTVSKCSSDICQLRLDFDSLALAVSTGPAIITTNYGCCGSACTQDGTAAGIASATDSLTVTGQTGRNPPVICGINTGYHMYVDMGTASTDTVKLDFYTIAGNKYWNTRVTQIPCDASYRPPAGCTQYFTGTSGTIASYGFQSGQLLQSQQYNNCIRQEEGYCSVTYSESPTTSPDPFIMTNDAILNAALSTADGCVNSYIRVPDGQFIAGTQANQFCGAALGVTTDTIPAPLTSTSTPFTLGVFSDTSQMEQTTGTAANTASTGFNLNYAQTAC